MKMKTLSSAAAITLAMTMLAGCAGSDSSSAGVVSGADGSAAETEAAVVTEPRLALVKQAGKQYAETGRIDVALLDEICSPMIPEEQYAAIVNGGE